MDFITAYAVYMTVAILVIGLWGLRVPHENVKVVFILAMLWPASILAILAMMVLNATDWEMDFAKGKTLFGFRKATNPQVRGCAITILFLEFQFYSKRKA